MESISQSTLAQTITQKSRKYEMWKNWTKSWPADTDSLSAKGKVAAILFFLSPSVRPSVRPPFCFGWKILFWISISSVFFFLLISVISLHPSAWFSVVSFIDRWRRCCCCCCCCCCSHHHRATCQSKTQPFSNLHFQFLNRFANQLDFKPIQTDSNRF